MNFTTLLAAIQPFLTTLGPVAEPILLTEWTGSLLPKIQAAVAGITNADEKFCAGVALNAVDQMVQYYIKKV